MGVRLRDCQQTCKGGKKPPGWRNLVVTKVSLLNWDGMVSDRDGVLCPEHVRELDGLLKPLGGDSFDMISVPNQDGSITFLPGDPGEANELRLFNRP